MRNLTDLKELDTFYNEWDMTWEGALVDNDSEQWLLKELGTSDSEVVIVSGKQMNDYYHLTKSNAYPNDLHIVVLTKRQPNKLAIQYGARWFTDIVDNNERREQDND